MPALARLFSVVLSLLVLCLVSPAQAEPTGPRDPRSDPDEPTPAEIRQAHVAQRRTDQAALDVAAIQSQLAAATNALLEAEVAAMQAAEDYNGARYRARQAQSAAAAAAQASADADERLTVQRESYRVQILQSYGAGVSMGMSGVVGYLDSDGMPSVIERDSATGVVADAFEEQRVAFTAAAAEAEAAAQRAAELASAAEEAEAEAFAAREAAEVAAEDAAAVASSYAAEKSRLVARLAALQDISVELAEEAGLEPPPDSIAELPDYGLGLDLGDAPGLDRPGAAAAIAFARDQIGEPYVWAAAGPGSWDCSGLTMGAWAMGGKALPHYSVAQYATATPIRSSDLGPGDLLFWSTSGDPADIFHVALYVGGGMMIHAPRTGRPVSLESMFSWLPPTHFARP